MSNIETKKEINRLIDMLVLTYEKLTLQITMTTDDLESCMHNINNSILRETRKLTDDLAERNDTYERINKYSEDGEQIKHAHEHCQKFMDQITHKFQALTAVIDQAKEGVRELSLADLLDALDTQNTFIEEYTNILENIANMHAKRTFGYLTLLK